ncbi:hypothetical protein [Rhizobium leguminosarum]|uniref:hypothetical protein n=1 Tax=Rhizobium leguminosarum TaxID=384 RepID=UPI0014412753|nr:hypothetical protein [Rhizobium leguminosarum]NKJ77777.1 hypothetical protein [Rhizobium leguminosarum bv. viciae]
MMKLWWQESPIIKDMWRLFDANDPGPRALCEVATHALWSSNTYPWRLQMFFPERTLDEFATLEEAKSWAEEVVQQGKLQ